MVKNDWIYSVLIGCISILLTFCVVASKFFLFSSMYFWIDYLYAFVFFTALTGPFIIGIIYRKPSSYKYGFKLGLKISISISFAVLLTLLLYIIPTEDTISMKSIIPILTVATICFVGFTLLSLIIPLFRKKKWKENNTLIEGEEILDNQN